MSKRRRTRLQRLKHSFVVTFSAAAAGSAGCDALAERSDDDGSRGRPPFGPVAGGVPVTPFIPISMNPPLVNPDRTLPCPTEVPLNGTPCLLTAQQICTYPAPIDLCPTQTTAQCSLNVWVVHPGGTGSCWITPPQPEPPVEEDAGLDDDAGFDVDA